MAPVPMFVFEHHISDLTVIATVSSPNASIKRTDDILDLSAITKDPSLLLLSISSLLSFILFIVVLFVYAFYGFIIPILFACHSLR